MALLGVSSVPNLLPSCGLVRRCVVGVDDAGALLVGTATPERLITHPPHGGMVQASDAALSRSRGTGDQRFRPEELSTLGLRSLRANPETYLGAPIDEAIISFQPTACHQYGRQGRASTAQLQVPDLCEHVIFLLAAAE